MPSKQLNQSELLDTAIREGTAAFQKAVAAFSTEKFYVFCFYTDSDITSIYPSANTIEGYRRITDGQEDIDYKWYPDECDIDFGQHSQDLFVETNKLLFPSTEEYNENETGEEFLERKKETIETLSQALLSVRASGVFGLDRSPDEIVCFVSISDAEDEEVKMMFHPVSKHLPEQAKAELRELYEW